MVIVAIFMIAKIWNQTICPTTEDQIRKMWLCRYNGVLSVIKINLSSEEKQSEITQIHTQMIRHVFSHLHKLKTST